jgi:hypothetical protein
VEVRLQKKIERCFEELVNTLETIRDGLLENSDANLTEMRALLHEKREYKEICFQKAMILLCN